MTDPGASERVALRQLPPVEPVRWPERLSQTLAHWLDDCPRAAYLYVKTGGGAPTHFMDRGTLYHEGAKRLMVDLIQHGEERWGSASEEHLSAMTAEIIAEVSREHPELVVSHRERDVARMCLYHLALGMDANPEHVVGLERKFLLELDCGWTVSGIVDLALMPDPNVGEVLDYKTQLHVPPQAEWDFFQAKLYACLLVWGRPVETVVCGDCEGTGVLPGEPDVDTGGCPACGGHFTKRGRGYEEEFGTPIGGHLGIVTGRELYPRHDPRKRADKKLPYNSRTWTRLELQEMVQDLEALGETLSGRLESWDFPARHDPSWCGRCPAENECPIPRQYRRFAGHITTREEAEEAWAWAERISARVGATRDEVKKFAAEKGISIRAGGDTIWEWTLGQPSRKMKLRRGRIDWDGFEEAIEAALERGEPFSLDEWAPVGRGASSFKKSKRPEAEGDGNVSEEVAPSAEERTAKLDERFGADAPW
jgi:hypothetical protein